MGYCDACASSTASAEQAFWRCREGRCASCYLPVAKSQAVTFTVEERIALGPGQRLQGSQLASGPPALPSQVCALTVIHLRVRLTQEQALESTSCSSCLSTRSVVSPYNFVAFRSIVVLLLNRIVDFVLNSKQRPPGCLPDYLSCLRKDDGIFSVSRLARMPHLHQPADLICSEARQEAILWNILQV